MALFGAPIAHEDAPRRAVHAALAIQRALESFGKDLEKRSGLVVQMRIALNTGIVVVGRITDDLRMDYTAIGDTINLASRLQSAARPTSVVISEATHKAIEGFFDTVDTAHDTRSTIAGFTPTMINFFARMLPQALPRAGHLQPQHARHRVRDNRVTSDVKARKAWHRYPRPAGETPKSGQRL